MNFIKELRTTLRAYRINSANEAVKAHDIIRIDGLQTYTTAFNSRYEARHFAKALRNRIGMSDFNITVCGKSVKVRKKF